jgi:hypothetical protein
MALEVPCDKIHGTIIHRDVQKNLGILFTESVMNQLIIPLGINRTDQV